MYAQDHNTTADSDIVVELRGVCKTFRQKQRSERLRDTVRTMFRPPIREVRALQQGVSQGDDLIGNPIEQVRRLRFDGSEVTVNEPLWL